MNKYILIVIAFLNVISISCSNYAGEEEVSARAKVEIERQSQQSETTFADDERWGLDLTPFDVNCADGHDLWVGKIQSFVQDKLYVFYDCPSEKNASLQIWESIEGVFDPSKLLADARRAVKVSDFEGFKRDCFTYEVDGMVRPKSELDRYDYKFPFISKHYRYINDKWVLLDSSRIENLNHFASFQLNKVSGDF